MQFDKLKPVDQLVLGKHIADELYKRVKDAQRVLGDELTDEYLTKGTDRLRGTYGSLSIRDTPPKDPVDVWEIDDQDALTRWVRANGGEVPDGIVRRTTLAQPEKSTTAVTKNKKAIEAARREIADGLPEAVRGLLEGVEYGKPE